MYWVSFSPSVTKNDLAPPREAEPPGSVGRGRGLRPWSFWNVVKHRRMEDSMAIPARSNRWAVREFHWGTRSSSVGPWLRFDCQRVRSTLWCFLKVDTHVVAEIAPCQPCPRQTTCQYLWIVKPWVSVSAQCAAFGGAGSCNGSWLFESASRSRGETALFRLGTKFHKTADTWEECTFLLL